MSQSANATVRRTRTIVSRLIAAPIANLEVRQRLWRDRVFHSRPPRDLLPMSDGCFVHHAYKRFEDIDLSRGSGQLGRAFYTWAYTEPPPTRHVRHRVELCLTTRQLGRLTVLLVPSKADPAYFDLLWRAVLPAWRPHDPKALDHYLAAIDVVIAPVDARYHGLFQAAFRPTAACLAVLAKAELSWSEYDKAKHTQRAREVCQP